MSDNIIHKQYDPKTGSVLIWHDHGRATLTHIYELAGEVRKDAPDVTDDDITVGVFTQDLDHKHKFVLIVRVEERPPGYANMSVDPTSL